MSIKTKQRRRYASAYKFAKLSALNGMIDRGGEYAKDGHKVKRRLSEFWIKRTSQDVEGFFKPQHAVPTP